MIDRCDAQAQLQEIFYLPPKIYHSCIIYVVLDTSAIILQPTCCFVVSKTSNFEFGFDFQILTDDIQEKYS